MCHLVNFLDMIKPEDHWSCITYPSAEDMLKSVVIEEKKFKHSPWAGAEPIRAKILMSKGRPHRNGHSLQVWKESLQPLTLYTSFHDLMNVYSHRSGGDNPKGQNFYVNRNLLSLGHLLQVSKNSLWSLILHNCFQDFIHVYSPAAEADNPLVTKFWCQQEHLVPSVIYCKFKKKIALKSDFMQFFSWFKTCT